jgi:alkylation response protein AidB-like acyl-CoA dehydrogenase
VSGKKIFATMAPASTILNAAVTYRDEKNVEYYGYAQVPTDAAGVTVHDDWNALGMRASASVTVSFEEAHIPMEALRDRLPIGEVSDPFLERNLNTGPLHASAPLGIAESAEQDAVEALRRRGAAPGKRRSAERPYVLMQAAENEIDLAAARATFGRAAELIDRYYAEHPSAPGDRDEIRAVFQQSQIAKAFVQSAAIRIVDRALAMSGGAGYMNTHRLSRLYRDVRATPFMHPLGANVAYELIGQITLGLEPTLD